MVRDDLSLTYERAVQLVRLLRLLRANGWISIPAIANELEIAVQDLSLDLDVLRRRCCLSDSCDGDLRLVDDHLRAAGSESRAVCELVAEVAGSTEVRERLRLLGERLADIHEEEDARLAA